MADPIQNNWSNRLTYSLAFILVLMGLANNLPNIPGLLELIQSILHKPLHELHQTYEKMMPVLEHNKKVYLENTQLPNYRDTEFHN